MPSRKVSKNKEESKPDELSNKKPQFRRISEIKGDDGSLSSFNDETLKEKQSSNEENLKVSKKLPNPKNLKKSFERAVDRVGTQRKQTLSQLDNQPAIVAKRFDIKELLPHKEALKDLRHVVHFALFQGSELGDIADGESFRIMKHNLNQKESYEVYLDVLEMEFDVETIRDKHNQVKSQTKISSYMNRFFSPLDEKQIENSYLVALFDQGIDVCERQFQVCLHD